MPRGGRLPRPRPAQCASQGQTPTSSPPSGQRGASPQRSRPRAAGKPSPASCTPPQPHQASPCGRGRSNRLKKILFHQCPCNGRKKVSLLNHHNPNCSGVPQNLTWCQWFGETKIHATKKAILRCFYFPKQFSWPGAQCSPKTMILRVNLRYFGTL